MSLLMLLQHARITPEAWRVPPAPSVPDERAFRKDDWSRGPSNRRCFKCVFLAYHFQRVGHDSHFSAVTGEWSEATVILRQWGSVCPIVCEPADTAGESVPLTFNYGR
jgi:hypothetical protein